MKLVSCEFIDAVLDVIREHFVPPDASVDDLASVRAAVSSATRWANGTVPCDSQPDSEPEPEPART